MPFKNKKIIKIIINNFDKFIWNIKLKVDISFKKNKKKENIKTKT